MSSSNRAARNSQTDAPFALQRRRTLVACTNCRRRKMRCITTEQPPKNPCARCTKKHLPCEYVSVEEDDPVSANPSPDLSSSALPTSGAHSGRPQTQTPAWAGQPMPPSNHFSRGPGTAPPLPYTGPPPFNQPPRFSGSQYPDLSLYGSSQPSNPSPYYPAHANPALANQGTQAYQYGANSGPPPTQPGAQQPGSGGYPTGYGQMPYYGQTPMPGYGWPPQQGSSNTYPGNDPRYGQ